MRADLSPQGRADSLRRIRTGPLDVLVIGGGIVGAGIARDAALRGLRTGLVDRGDFASGTSGKTSRLVHGGLRYLKNFQIGLVRQAVRERDLLLERSPSLVTPLAFTIPAYPGRGMGRTTLRFGLWVYDFLSRDKVLPRRRWLAPGAVRDREPGLSAVGLDGGGLYHDALTNDARLVLGVVRSAADAGAAVANYAEVTELVRDGGRVRGARIRDRRTGETLDGAASVVVNATGVWLDRLRTRDAAAKTIRPTKGIHVFLPRDKVGNREAVVLNARRDGRMLFVLPWGELTLVGTTDTDFRGDADRVLPDAADVAYLLEAVNDAFPAAHVSAGDVVSAYAGLRPLIDRGSATEESDISRGHELFEDRDGLISVAGGKLTTHRAMAEQTVDRICRRLGRRTACRTAATPMGPGPEDEAALRSLGVPGAEARFLASRHSAEDLQPWLDEAGALEAIASGLPYRWIEVRVAVQREMAMTLEDVMVRRLGLFYEAADQGTSVAPAVAERMASDLGWDVARRRDEVQAYRALVEAHRRFRGGP